MAKLSDRQKNNIKAKWHTGEYSKRQLAKLYKVNEKTIREIVAGEEPTNADIVQASYIVEKAKNSAKTPQEKREIESAVKARLEKEFNDDNNRLKVYDLTGNILDKVQAYLERGKNQQVVQIRHIEGSEAQIIETDLQAVDYEKCMNTVDKASITLNVNDRHSKNQIAMQQNNTNQGVKTVGFETIESHGN